MLKHETPCGNALTFVSPNAQYNMYYGGMQAPQRSTTVPPDWLSMPPPNAWNAPSVSSVGPSFTPPQQPMRYRSLTPHGGGGSY